MRRKDMTKEQLRDFIKWEDTYLRSAVLTSDQLDAALDEAPRTPNLEQMLFDLLDSNGSDRLYVMKVERLLRRHKMRLRAK
jgi:hypothetical protein